MSLFFSPSFLLEEALEIYWLPLGLILTVLFTVAIRRRSSPDARLPWLRYRAVRSSLGYLPFYLAVLLWVQVPFGHEYNQARQHMPLEAGFIVTASAALVGGSVASVLLFLGWLSEHLAGKKPPRETRRPGAVPLPAILALLAAVGDWLLLLFCDPFFLSSSMQS